MDKLEYVELLYDHQGQGLECRCHYASGRTTSRPYQTAQTDRYILANALVKGSFLLLRARDCLDGCSAAVMGWPTDSQPKRVIFVIHLE